MATAKNTAPKGDETTTDKTDPAATYPAPDATPHDRVQMLSLKADGTPDQTNPEFIVDEATALATTSEQLKQQAVSVLDSQSAPVAVEDAPQDPEIAAAKAAHDEAAAAAEDRAAALVDQIPTRG